jgi:methionyl-tRNA synthetase
MARALITSALPYVNGVKHLGNLAGSLLPADIHARYRRQIGDETLFICATDEHGTPAELAAAEAGIPVSDYCSKQHAIQADIYRRLHLSFDHFGRSSCLYNHLLTQHLFRCLDEQGLIAERTLRQIYSPVDRRFLPDRYIVGTCPHCGFRRARGDQCESCTRTLDPVDLVEPRSALSASTALEVRPTRHLFLCQTALVDKLEKWIDSRHGWPRLVSSIARKWLAEGIRDRCITRDLSWGVPVPKPGYEGKVFYVWFDAPIAYIAATQEWSGIDPKNRDWRVWWWNPQDVEYCQFLGKDNVPFHAISFPCTLIGSGEPWKTVDIIKGQNWLTYDGGKFSTSQRRGVFLDQALDLLPADYWRWWLASNSPENADTNFTFDRFAVDVNEDLADNFGNLVNRVLKLLAAKYNSAVPGGGTHSEVEHRLIAELDQRLTALRAHHDALAIRKAADEVRSIWRLANAYFATEAPWTAADKETARAAVAVRTSVNLVAAAATLAAPFIPEAAARVLNALGLSPEQQAWTSPGSALTRIQPGHRIAVPPVLFAKLTPQWVEDRKRQFSGELPA